MQLFLPGIKAWREDRGSLILVRRFHFCAAQVAVDAGCFLFIFSVVYSLIENADLRTMEFSLLLIAAFVWLLFYLRRLTNFFAGKVEVSSKGISWRHTALGGITWVKSYTWDEIESVYTAHENPPERNKNMTGYFLELRPKNGSSWALLRSVTDYNAAVLACQTLDEWLAQNMPLHLK